MRVLIDVISYALLISVFSRTARAWRAGDNLVTPSCPKEAKVCHFHFDVDYNMTMITWDHGRGEPVMRPILRGANGDLYKKNIQCMKFKVSEEEIQNSMLGDGRYKRVMVINGQLPGPPIVVYKGQYVSVTVTNSMENEAMTLHWHGLHMRKSPWMDGGGTVSHCPILPGQIFQYRYEAELVGTHWYHGHIGTQRTMGMAGPLVVLEDSAEVENSHRGEDKIPKIDAEFHMMIMDWSVKRSDKFQFDVQHLGMRFTNGYDAEKCFSPGTYADGSEASFMNPESILINGRGRYLNPETDEPEIPELPVEIFTVKEGGRFRFRVTNSGMNFPLRVSVDEHELNIIASDGSDIKTTKAESLIIAPGERYDFWIETNDPTKCGNYWIRAEILNYYNRDGKRIKPLHTEAVLRYEGAPLVEPKTSRRACSAKAPCVVVNCIFKSYPLEENIICLHSTDLRKPVLTPGLNIKNKADFTEKILSFELVNSPQFVSSINGRLHFPYTKPPQIFPKTQRMITCNDTECDQKSCICTHELRLKKDNAIQLTFFAPRSTSGHPIHMHGHRFEVVKIGWPVYDCKTAKYKANSPDIDCSYTPGVCNRPVWANPTWNNGNIPLVITEGAIEKDTVYVPAGGYVVVRFKADNPGYWLMHCHMEPHSSTGMMLTIKEGEDEDMPAVPKNFPRCDDYFTDDEELSESPNSQPKKINAGEKFTKVTGMKTKSRQENRPPSSHNFYQYLSIFLGIALALMSVLWIIAVYQKHKSSKMISGEYMSLLSSERD